MERVIRDGKVAVLYSPGWGSGWFTWNHNEELLYDPTIVEMVESRARLLPPEEVENLNSFWNEENEWTSKIIDYCREKYTNDSYYFGGANDLEIKWIPIGTRFRVEEHDGNEVIILEGEDEWMIA